jgi:glycosyltransferase involved in cell wall biosynthesis
MSIGSVRRVAIVGNHTPRQCGIATFTADVNEALAGTGISTQVVAVNDKVQGYDYPESVTFQIAQDELKSYRDAAAYLNSQELDVICVQHEYGIFGGRAGSHLLTLLREVNPPIVTTLHTILESPNADQRAVLAELSQLSERFIVMSHRGKKMLQDVNGIDPAKISVVLHGIPSVERAKPDAFLKKLGLEGKRVILTFGLIGPDKGIEYMVAAMPEVVRHHPDAHYLIVGATHPNIRQFSGEAYRQNLIELADKLEVSSHIDFVDRFVDLNELTDYLQAASIYVTPYLKREQITSGTLSYAFGSGKAVVSTPYWHAEELLADGHGCLVPFRDSDRLAEEIVSLLSDPERLECVQAASYNEGLAMAWPVVGQEYLNTFDEALQSSRSLLPHLTATEPQTPKKEVVAQQGFLDYLSILTDDTGIVQHATFSIPNRFEGYCTDDNARLAIVGARMESNPKLAKFGIELQHKGLSFLHHAFNEENGQMRNFMGFDRVWLEEAGSQDSHGRALWALGQLSELSSVHGVRTLANKLFLKGLPSAVEFQSPRAIAFTLLGLQGILASSHSPECLNALRHLSDRLSQLYNSVADDQWKWFELSLAYDNARLPQALMAAASLLDDDEKMRIGKGALNWLIQVQTDPMGYFLPIGSNGFYTKHGISARYDQQPLEATATIDACYEALLLTGESQWEHEVYRAYQWFHGANSEGHSMIDEATGGCLDGLLENDVNRNQGAESTLAYISSVLVVEQMARVKTTTRNNGFLG